MYNNTLMIIHPYKDNGTWVFDDKATGLVKEPFVAGMPEIIDNMVESNGIDNAEDGFTAVFSGDRFPGYDYYLTWNSEEHGGNWYSYPPYQGSFQGNHSSNTITGWLCPALFKYFDKAPSRIYIQVKEKNE